MRKNWYTILGGFCLGILMVIALQGCAVFDRDRSQPEQPPQSTRCIAPNLANGYVMLAQVRLMAADSVRTGILTAQEGKRALELTDTARQTLDKSRDALFASGNDQVACQALDITDVLLSQVRRDIEALMQKRKEKAK